MLHRFEIQSINSSRFLMELLCNAYSNSSSEEETHPPPPPRKRTKFQSLLLPPPQTISQPAAAPSALAAPVPGRYISKRERAALHSPSSSSPNTTLPVTSPVLGSIRDSDIPREILTRLRRVDPSPHQTQVPQNLLSVPLNSHTKPVNAINWSPTHAHLLASAGMDHAVCVWNVWSRHQKLARVFRIHNAAVKDVKFSRNGLSVLSCGYDCSSRLIDVEKGVESQVFEEDQIVGVIKYHPNNSNIFLSGGSKGHIRLWDTRTGKVVHEYVRGLGPILDVEFMVDGKQFISSSDVSGSNISENSIMVWDVSRGVPLSNQINEALKANFKNFEPGLCGSLYIRCHPFDPSFIAQCNGNYIAIFSSNSPFKLDKYKRYEGHGVSGFPVKCNFSLDGEKLVSSSSDGSIYFYDYRSSKVVRKFKAFEQACIDVAFHPVMPDVVASCSWNGEVLVFR